MAKSQRANKLQALNLCFDRKCKLLTLNDKRRLWGYFWLYALVHYWCTAHAVYCLGSYQHMQGQVGRLLMTIVLTLHIYNTRLSTSWFHFQQCPSELGSSLIPRPSTPSVFDQLQHAKMEEGLGNLIMRSAAWLPSAVCGFHIILCRQDWLPQQLSTERGHGTCNLEDKFLLQLSNTVTEVPRYWCHPFL